MSQSIATQQQDNNKILEQVITKGDLASLTPVQRVSYYNAVCQSLKLNPLTKPFDFLELHDKQTGKTKIVLYARKDATEQLRKINGVSIIGIDQRTENDCYVVTACARTPDGREDVDDGVVFTKGLTGESLANARMKAVTKAKRRVTLSICGLGFLDESEIDSIPDAQPLPSPEQDAVMTEQDAVMTENEARHLRQLTLSHRSIGLDQWKCKRATAMLLLNICRRLAEKGVDDELMRSRLPGGVQSRKDLTEEQAQETIKIFQHWLNTYNEVVEGGMTNG